MCVKLPHKDLNFGLCPQHSTSIYTGRVTTAPKVRGGFKSSLEYAYIAFKIGKYTFTLIYINYFKHMSIIEVRIPTLQNVFKKKKKFTL